ncbi:MAG: CpsD/CapB family tyrosine-protein kinase [Clostridium butyricum]|nr:CpsD/CapB family tyrosine-protein kinase [Clostridium butyricum]
MYLLELEKKSNFFTNEAYKMLRTNIMYSSFDKKIKSIILTSGESGDGKSTISANLALSFSKSSINTIVVDCDLRNPSQHKLFKISNETGISEILIGKCNVDEAVVRYNDYLHVLPTGKVPPDPCEMLSSRAMTRLLDVLNSMFEIVILDTPPITLVSDAQILSKKVDGTIIVAREAKSKLDDIMEVKQLLNNVGANILGVVLNYKKINTKKYYSYR